MSIHQHSLRRNVNLTAAHRQSTSYSVIWGHVRARVVFRGRAVSAYRHLDSAALLQPRAGRVVRSEWLRGWLHNIVHEESVTVPFHAGTLTRSGSWNGRSSFTSLGEKDAETMWSTGERQKDGKERPAHHPTVVLRRVLRAAPCRGCNMLGFLASDSLESGLPHAVKRLTIHVRAARTAYGFLEGCLYAIYNNLRFAHARADLVGQIHPVELGRLACEPAHAFEFPHQ